MSFQLNKNSSGRIIKKIIPQGISSNNIFSSIPFLSSANCILVNNRNFEPSIPIVTSSVTTSNGTIISETGVLNTTVLNKAANIINGTASPGKVLTLDANKTASGIGILKCNSVKVNNVDIVTSIGDPSSIVVSNDYFSNNTVGTAGPGKCLIADSSLNMSIKKINGDVADKFSVLNSENKNININLAKVSNLSNKKWTDVVYSIDLQKFLAIGDEIVAASADGSAWTEYEKVGLNFKRIVWSSNTGKFFSCTNEKVLESSDGIDWTTIMENTGIIDVSVGISKIVVLKNGTIFSKDLSSTEWVETAMTSAMASKIWNGMTYGSSNIYGNRFVIVGDDNISTCLESDVQTNTNWINTAIIGSWNSVSFGNDIFMSVNKSSIATNKITTSSNGVNWFYGNLAFREAEIGMENVGFRNVKFLQFINLFIILPIFSTNYFLYTKAGDDIYFSKYSSNGLLRGIDYSHVLKKVVGITSGKSLENDNNFALSLQPDILPLKYIKNNEGDYDTFNGFFTFNNSHLPNMVFGCNSRGLLYSSDGLNFNKCFLLKDGGNIFDQVNVNVLAITYASHISTFIAITTPNATNGILNSMVSTDGINWTFSAIMIPTTNMVWIEYSSITNKIYVVGANNLYISSNGTSWTSQPYTGGNRISVIDGVIILHGNHASKLYHIVNENLSYTPLNTSLAYLNPFIKFNNSLYSFTGNIVYKSIDNGSSWTIENNLGASVSNMVFHEGLNCLAVYTGDNKVATLNSSGVWTVASLINYSMRSLTSICYNSVYKCVYLSMWWPPFTIARTTPIRSECLVSNNIFGENKIWRTLPDFSTHEREMDDNIITAFKYNTTLRSLTASPEGYREIYYSRKTNKLYVIIQYTSAITINTLESVTNFVDSTNTAKYSNLLDTNIGLWAVVGSSVSSSAVTTSSSNTQLYNKFSNSTSSISTVFVSNISHLTAVIARFKFCKEVKSIYIISGNVVTLYYPEYSSTSNINLTSEVFTFTITGSPTLLGGALCKELNMALCFSNTGGGKIISLDMRDVTKAKSIVSISGKTFVQIEYHYNAKMFVILATDAVYYSFDGSTVQPTPTSGLTGNTYIWSFIKYIPELNVMGLVSTNMFAFTRDGINWTVMPTSVQKPWISFDYNRGSGNILLLSSTGEVLVSSPIASTVDGILNISNGYMSKDKLSISRANSTNNYIESDYSVNVEGGIVARSFNKNLSIDNNNDTSIVSNTILNIVKTNTNSDSRETLKINGNNLSINASLLDNVTSLPSMIDAQNNYMEPLVVNNFKIVQKGGSLSFNDVSTTNLTITNNSLSGGEYEDMGLVVADSNKNVKIDNIGLNSVVINGVEIKSSPLQHPLLNSSPPKESPFMSLDKYITFKNTSYINGVGVIIGSAYSPELNLIVIVANANSSTISNYISVSNNKGKTWTNTGINNGFGFTVDTDTYTCKVKWISSLSLFIITQDNNIMISYDGYNWYNNNISYGSNPSIMIDSKLNRLTILTTSRVAYPENMSNLLGNWIVPVANKTLKMAEYFQPLDLYFFRDNTTNAIKHTSDIYVDTIISTTTSTISLIADMIVWNGMLYYTSSSNIYRRNVAGAGDGNIVFTHPSITFKRLVIVDTVSILVAFSTLSFAYTSNGLNWVHILYSNSYVPSHTGQTLEGAMNNMFWAKDRLMMLLSSNGTLLESNIEEFPTKLPISHMNTIINNRLSSDKLLTSSKGIDTIIRHSLTPMNIYATAYGNGFFVSTGDNVNIISTSLKKNQSAVAHTGQWRDIVYHKKTNQFVKIGSDIMSYNLGTDVNTTSWTDITPPPGTWESIISIDNKVIIFQSGTSAIAKIASVDIGSELNSSTIWNDVYLSQTSIKWNGIEIINGLVILTGLNYISYKSLDQIDNSSVSWIDNYFLGNWNDVSYGKNLYVFAGDGLIGRSRNLSIYRKTQTPKNYHKVIYVRLLSDFYLMNKEVNYFSNTVVKDQTNSVIKSSDGINYINSMNSFLHATTVTAARPYYLSNIYYFEETDQFAMPLNNSQNKYYIFTNTYAPKASNYKITTPETFTTNSSGSTVEIARGNSVITAPATFNVFQDSASKPATSTWITTSDERLKEDIVPADLEQCFNNIKSLDLKYFKWKDEYITKSITSDRRKLGWIAQDVESVMPKSVKKKNMFNMEDCRVLDSDQIIANMFGAVKMLIKKIKEKEQILSESKL
jgi:hypothetical protein